MPYGKCPRYAPISDDAVRRLRAHSQAAVAALLGVTVQAVRQWYRRDRPPSYDHACALLGLAAFDGLSLLDFGYVELPNGCVARLLAPGHATAPLVFQRADGWCFCDVCGAAYRLHRQDRRRDNDLDVRILCDGRRVKL